MTEPQWPAIQDPEHRSDLTPLVRLLTRADGFALAFLECNEATEAERAIAQLTPALAARGRQSRLLRLRSAETDVLKRILSMEPALGSNEALFVLGFELGIPSRMAFPPALTRLNRSRELFRQLPCPVVLVLPSYAIDQVSCEAPDFWAWRSGVYELRGAQGPPTRMPQRSLELDYANLPAVRKQEHLEVLEGLLMKLKARGDESLGDTSRLCLDLAELLTSMGRWGEARDYGLKALKLARRPGDQRIVANAYHQLGRIAQLRGSYDEARDRSQKARRIFEELGDSDGVAKSYHLSGIVAQETGSLEEARKLYDQGLRIFEDLGNGAGQTVSYLQLGNVRYLHGSYDEALEWYRKAHRLAEELGNRADLGNASHQLGLVAQARGSHEEALERYDEALRIFEELGNREGAASSLSNMGILHTMRGSPQKAVPLSLRGLTLRLELQIPRLSTELYWLGRQRHALGEERFQEIAAMTLPEESLQTVMKLIERSEADQA